VGVAHLQLVHSTPCWIASGKAGHRRGIIFQVPFNCTADEFFLTLAAGNVAADSTVTLYSDPTGTPTSVGSVNVLGEHFERNNNSWFQGMLLNLTANTDYCLAAKGTGASNVSMSYFQLPDTNLRKFISGGTTLKKATRNNGSGAFAPESPATTIYQMGLRVLLSAGGGGGYFSVCVIGS
jgi:hypothetical protein